MNKTLVIPGWMSRVKNYQLGDGLEIWQEFVDPATHLDAEYLIGHSLGANFALLNWRKNKNTKLILVSPMLSNITVFNWFFRWLRYIFNEGLTISSKDIRSNKIFFGIKTAYGFLRLDYANIIREIPKEKLLVIRGKKDNFVCDKATAEFIKKEQIRLIEIEDCAHNWNEKFRQAVIAVLNEWQKH